MKSFFLATLGLVIGFSGCKKKSTQNQNSALEININYKIDSDALQIDTIRYINDAGNEYSINRLEYYISNITLQSATETKQFPDIYYINAFTDNTNHISIGSVPYGRYQQISFNIGIKPEFNLTQYLTNTLENINMAWPDAMGGGYHFLKLEGHVLLAGSKLGYAMHLGTNLNLVTCKIPVNLDINQSAVTLNMVMNINEWYRNPNTYDIILDGNHTMTSQPLMAKIAANGQDVFTIE